MSHQTSQLLTLFCTLSGNVFSHVTAMFVNTSFNKEHGILI